MNNTITRRDFIKYTGLSTAGIAFGIYITSAEKLLSQDIVFMPNIWLQIDKNGFVTITMHRTEMGQKVWTALPMIVAEELDADWSKVKVVQGDLNDDFGSQVTGGSASVRTSYNKLRKAGAAAREMLLTAASIQWGIDISKCIADSGYIINTITMEKLGYGELVDVASSVKAPISPKLKDPKDFKIIGKSKKSLGQADKIDGKLKYGFDLNFPGMMTAVVTHCPVMGGKAISFDDSESRKVKGVSNVFAISTGVAVVGKTTWAVLKGSEKLKIEWELGENKNLNTVAIYQTFRDALKEKGNKVLSKGDFYSAIKDSYKQIEATYEGAYLDHATMEPMNCTVKIDGQNCELWVPTQDPAGAFKEAQKITGFPKKKIKIHTLKAGGGFGRRLAEDYVKEAVEVALFQQGTVKVIRTREEDIKNGVYRPATINQVKGAIDSDGNPSSWMNRISGPDNSSYWTITGGADELPYDIPNIHIDYVRSKIAVPIGPMRAVGNIQNAFVNESFIDELAYLANKDPLEYRIQLMKNNKRQLNVLKTAADAANWSGPKANGKFYGLASHYCFQSYAAIVAEISILNNRLKINRMICAIDCGLVINPNGVKAQIESGISIGLSAALFGEITFDNGNVEQTNFHNYKIVRMDQMPIIEAHIIESYEPPTGAGEPPVPPTAPSLTNAIFAGTGVRHRSLPLKTIKLA